MSENFRKLFFETGDPICYLLSKAAEKEISEETGAREV